LKLDWFETGRIAAFFVTGRLAVPVFGGSYSKLRIWSGFIAGMLKIFTGCIKYFMQIKKIARF